MDDSSRGTFGVVGLGYVGLPLALAINEAGYEVIGVDIDETRVQQLRNGKSYVKDVSNQEVKAALESGFSASTEYDQLSTADAVSVCVPTPLRKSGQPNISYVVDATERLASVVPNQCTVILESTVYPGATDEIVADYFSTNGRNIGEDIFVAFSPERIDPGNERYGVTDIPKVVGGVTNACTEQAVRLYRPVFADVIEVTSSSEAEFVKLLENTFRSVNIGLINELALTADQMAIDIWEVIEAAATKPFGFMPFYPGPGLGGHCIPIDPQQLSWKAKQQGFETRFIDLADRINRGMPNHVVNKVSENLNKDGVAMLDANILILGVAYKSNVSDTRESPALDVISLLRERRANVQYHDPYVEKLSEKEWYYESKDLSDELLENQDCVIVVTDHDSIDMHQVVELSPRIFDTRNATKGYAAQDHVTRL